MTRKAFTLVEVMVALVVTGLVIALAYASMQAGLETAERLEQAQAGEERETIARSILLRALRHAMPGTIGGEPVFILRDGAGGDELQFRTRGVSEPLGASARWDVSLTTGPGGVQLRGYAMDESARSFSAVLSRVRAIDVRVLGRDLRDGWYETWPVPDRSPVAVSITFVDGGGRAIGTPLVARVGLEGNQ